MPDRLPRSESPFSGHPPPSWFATVCWIIIFCLLGILYFRIFQPPPLRRSPPAERFYETAAMRAATSPEAVEARLEEILALGSRYLGQPGHRATAEYLREVYRKAGLEVFEHNVQTAAPRTRQREIFLLENGPDGQPRERVIPDLEIYPFMPNHLQGAVTPDGGLDGRLVLLNSETLSQTVDFNGAIGLLDARPGAFDPAFGFNWTNYARLGLRALIVTSSEGWDKIPWLNVCDRYTGMVSSVPVNYPRLAASPAILRLAGQTVRLKVEVAWENHADVSFCAVLRAAEPAQEGVVLMTPYDAAALLPDLAKAPLQAIPLAFQLQVLEGLVADRATLRRDVIFFHYGSGMNAHEGLNHLLRVLLQNSRRAEQNRLLAALGWESPASGPAPTEGLANPRLRPILKEAGENAIQAAHVAACLDLFEKDAFLIESAATQAAYDRLPIGDREFLKEQWAFVLNNIVLQLGEPLLKARLDLARAGEVTEGPVFEAYLEAKRKQDEAASVAGYSPGHLLLKMPRFAAQHRLREQTLERFNELARFHAGAARQAEEEKAWVRLFDRYRNFSFFETRLLPSIVEPETARSAEELAVFIEAKDFAPELFDYQAILRRSWEAIGRPTGLELTPIKTGHKGNVTGQHPAANWASMTMVREWGYASYAWASMGRRESSEQLASPNDLPYMHELGSIRHSLAAVGDSLLAIAHGGGLLRPMPKAEHKNRTFRGQVLVGDVGRTLIPTQPLPNALVAYRSVVRQGQYNFPGYYNHTFVFTDPYGRYSRRNCASDFINWWLLHVSSGHSPVAAGYDERGRIIYFKDEGPDGQRLFKSVNLSESQTSLATLVAFRAAPVAFFDLTNPQTLRDYKSIRLAAAPSLIDLRKQCRIVDVGVDLAFVQPHQRFDVLLEAGSPDNELVQEVRAFALGPRRTKPGQTPLEIDGRGYLAADHPLFTGLLDESAASLARVNGWRLALQNRYGMADGRTNDYHERGELALEAAAAAEQPRREAENHAANAVIYGMLNHPVLRQAVFEAVLGILWYLALLVPFVFFFEKLLFCATDVRRQLAVQAVIFLTVFLLLRFLHPAFAMVRSSLMILLGFVIILISGGVTLLFSTKFQENLDELRRRQGRVAGAEVNTMGVMGSAFLLGLNNMNRRKVRTGLTCATLVLLTFVMICFTSVQNDLVEQTVAVGKADFQGFLLKREMFARFSRAETFAVRQKYGGQYDVCQRAMWVGRQDWNQKTRKNTDWALVTRQGGFVRQASASSILFFDAEEPLARQLEFTTRRGWFTRAQQDGPNGAIPILLPDRLAAPLGITPQAVDAGQARIEIKGKIFPVQAIFKSDSMNRLRDLDGRDLLPFDIEAMTEVIQRPSGIAARDDDPRIPAEKLLIAPDRDLGIAAADADLITVSLAVSMPKAGYKEASTTIENYMIQSTQPLYYGLDGVAYRGERTRKVSLAGLVDLAIPLLLAGLTVLNTMRGSVYERRGEIHVYNAVGIAPRYIFLMFFAEAFVYAVVGSVLGYLLSQGTGRILTELGMTGGLNMTFTSIATIYASLTIMAAVFLSTWFPARSALDIAAPAEESGWRLPKPDGDELRFDLPFNFRARGRVAILAFFDRYLREHGEGGSGRFQAGIPQVSIEEPTGAETSATPMPRIEAVTWLKPFDLAVSQRLIIELPDDPDTGLYKARVRLVRLSGSQESWLRLNRGFVTLLRRHFLHWRAVPEEDRNEMFTEAGQLLRQQRIVETAQQAVK